MKTKLNYCIVLILFSIGLIAQELKKESKESETKMEAFSSKTGAITKFIDVKLPNLKTAYEVTETRVRKIKSGMLTSYFYQIVKTGKYSNPTASIEYSDLLEVIKALKTLKIEVEEDMLTKPDYLENKFITVDGFQIGYFVSKEKSTWYIKLEKYGTENTIFINDVSTIETSFNDAKTNIEVQKNNKK
jgi:hypothetical protein